MKKYVKAAAAVTAAAVMTASMSILASAQGEKDNMQKYLTAVKERVDISDEYSEFNYSTGKLNGNTYYRFDWTKSDKNSWGNIHATISGSVITEYYNYDDSVWNGEASFAKLSEKQLINAAKKHIRAIDPTVYKYIRVDEDSLNISLMSNIATLTVYRVKNDIPAEGQKGTIQLNKNTGELIAFNLNWILGAGFKGTDGTISESDAQKAFKREFPVELVYTAEYDWQNDEYKPHLIYKQTKTGQIDAYTGKLSTYDDYDYYGDGITTEEGFALASLNDENPATGAGYDSARSKAVSFSDAELQKLQDDGTLIAPEKQFEDTKALGIFYIPEGAEINSNNTYYNNRTKSYVTNVSFNTEKSGYTDLSGSIDIPIVDAADFAYTEPVYGSFSYNAQTGEIIYFNCYHFLEETDIDVQKAEKTAEKNLRTLLGKNRGKFGTLEQSGSEFVTPDPSAPGSEITTSLTLGAPRTVNGIKSEAENVSLTIGNDGLISDYNFNYYGIAYPKNENTISADEAYSDFFDQTDYSLKYRCAYRAKDKKVVTALVYGASDTLYIDAFTGKLANVRGSALNAEKSEYTDIKGSKYEKIAEKLADYGIVLMDGDGRLRENDIITVSEFSGLCERSGLGFDSSVNGEVKETDKVTRALAARLLVQGQYGDKIAGFTGIFKQMFTDIPENSEYSGYAAIADAAGLIKGDNGKFMPDTEMTRGMALETVYNYLSENK